MTAIPFLSNASRVESEATTSSPSNGQAVMWPVYATLFSSLCIVVGLIWDISWHRTVGRDTFWTYPHVLEQVAAIVSGFSCGWLVLHTTFSKSAGAQAMRDLSVRVWGFRGPLGAWVCIWGTVMMIVSAPFDNWWHNAYGLDVKILSPPHMVLAAGMISIELGALLIALAVYNRTSAAQTLAAQSSATQYKNKPAMSASMSEAPHMSWKFSLTYIVACGVILAMLSTAILERAGFANMMHASSFYRITAAIFPMVLVAIARGANIRWAATLSAVAYMLIILFMIWTLQLFEGTPMLAPINNPVTHMVPPPFPYLMIIPAFLLDLLLQRIKPGREWRTALLVGLGFLLSFLAIQWFFADFLLSPHARNLFFGADKWDYNARLGDWRYIYWELDLDARETWSPTKFLSGLGIAAIYAVLSSRIGLAIGNALRRVVR